MNKQIILSKWLKWSAEKFLDEFRLKFVEENGDETTIIIPYDEAHDFVESLQDSLEFIAEDEDDDLHDEH